MRSNLTYLILGLAFSVAPSNADELFTFDPREVKQGSYELDRSHGKITWVVNHLGFSSYIGQIHSTRATLVLDPKQPNHSTLSAKIDVASIATLHSKLDEVLKSKEFLNVAKFPYAEFKSSSIQVLEPKRARIAGELTLMGVTRPFEIEATFNQAGVHPVDKRYTVGFDGRGKLRRSDFGINAHLPAIGDEVTLIIEGEFKRIEKQ